MHGCLVTVNVLSLNIVNTVRNITSKVLTIEQMWQFCDLVLYYHYIYAPIISTSHFFSLLVQFLENS
jgi:hypothetical protein